MQEITRNTFAETISKGNVIVDFWAPWCGPCKMQSPILEAANQELEHITFCKVNVDDEPHLASDHNVRGIPMLVFFKDGQIVDQHAGILDKAGLQAKIEAAF